MKHFLIITITLLISLTAKADCASGSLSIFPTGNTIKQNSIFVIGGYASHQKIILELEKKNSVYLKSGDLKVRLFVKEIFVGQFEITQAVLTLEKPLEAGLEYELIIENLSQYDDLPTFSRPRSLYTPRKYKVTEGFDNEKPVLLLTPKEVDKSFTRFGCGPAEFVYFSYPVKDSSELLIKTTVKNLKSGIETTYCIQAQNDKISVGYGVCSGAFKYDESTDYEVEFSFIDASGNETIWQGERIKFTKPLSDNYDSWEK